MVLAISHQKTLYYDNSWSVVISKELRSHKRAKYIESKYHLIRDIIERREVIVCKIVFKENLADLFTKALPAKSFEGYLISLGI